MGSVRPRAAATLVALALLAACAAPSGDEPGGQATGPTAPGAVLAWSRAVAPGDVPIAVVGDTVVLADGGALLGLRRGDGAEEWRRPFAENDRFTVAGAHLVIERDRAGSIAATEPTDAGALEVLDAATGATRWQTVGTGRAVVRADAVYLSRRAHPGADLVTTAYAIGDGRPLWTVSDLAVAADAIGTRRPYAPPASPYLAASKRSATVEVLDARTGAVQPAQLEFRPWYKLVADRTLVVTDNDPPPNDDRCTVAVTAVRVDGTGSRTTTAFSGRHDDNTCERHLADTANGQAVLGSGTRIAVSSADGRPQVLDLATGETVWTASAPGVPIDGDGQNLLVRSGGDAGDLALLDLATGRPRWTAPDPGLSGVSASWNSAVTGGLVAVSGAAGERPFVTVYDADTGRLRGRFPSWLEGAGDDWVAVDHGGPADGRSTVEFWTF